MYKQLLKIVGLFICVQLIASVYLNAQDENSKLEVISQPTSGFLRNDGKIIVSIHSHDAPFTIGLTKESLPLKKDDFIHLNESTNRNNLEFTDLKNGTYFIFFKDNNGSVRIHEIQIAKSK